jgi:hypothetical protein
LAVSVRPGADDEKVKYGSRAAVVTTTSSFEPSAQVCAALEALRENRLPEGAIVNERLSSVFDQEDNMPDRALTWNELPEYLKSSCQNISKELGDAARSTVAVLLWVAGRHEGHRPLTWSSGVQWSSDAIDWHELPVKLEIYGYSEASFSIVEPIRDVVVRLVSNGLARPLGHELLAEARSQVIQNPRSALVIGLAAAEIGFKHCVADLVPDARWLVENVPSPPLGSMLAEYLPALPARQLLNDAVLPPPKSVLELLRKGVSMRNSLLHRGDVALSSEKVLEVLEAAEQVLWLLDYYRGFAWALTYVDRDILDEMGVKGVVR